MLGRALPGFRQLLCSGNDCRDGGALAGLRGHGEPAANGFDTVLHAGQAMGVGAHAGGLEPLAIVLNLHGYIGGVVVHRDDDMAGPGVLADIGQRLLHHAIDRQLRGLGQVHLLQTALHLDVAAIAELPGQDFQCRGQSQVGKRGRAKVLDDATLECNAAVERLDQMGDALGDLGCRSVDLGFESRNIEFGCGQQRAKLIMRISRARCARSSSRTCCKWVARLGECRCAVTNDFLQAIALVALDLCSR